jgi:hypothetical protein
LVTAVKKPVPLWKSALTMISNPGLVLKKAMSNIPWPFSLSISSLAFALFFLQTGLDLLRTGHKGITFVIVITLLGAIYGSLGVSLIALIAWGLSKAFGNAQTVKWTITAFGLGYSSTLIYVTLGIAFSLLFHWKTSVAFGVTGVLWATGPMIATIKEMTKERIGVSIMLATICSGLLLFGWSLLGMV